MSKEVVRTSYVQLSDFERQQARHLLQHFPQLQQQIQEAWDEIEQDVIRNLHDTMHHRVTAYIASRGGHTRY